MKCTGCTPQLITGTLSLVTLQTELGSISLLMNIHIFTLRGEMLDL